ncbi:MAG: hypothetical protein OXH09_14360 [Gammaproteobacteria bacterium]|nr:hypothetical protein [Gammaproteobacteria bacterium]
MDTLLDHQKTDIVVRTHCATGTGTYEDDPLGVGRIHDSAQK